MLNLNTKTLLHINLIPSIGPASAKRIIKNFDIKNIYNLRLKDFTDIGFSQAKAQSIVDGFKDKVLLDKELALIEKKKCKIITILDDQYPENLKNIVNPPIVLYCIGNTDLLNLQDGLAVVGSRAADEYAFSFIKNIIGPVSRKRLIISGGAKGVDSWAHQVAIDNNGRTISVLGSGLNVPYPTTNKKLFNDIIKNNGLVISNYPLNTPPNKSNFPARNRIVSGLSSCCVVVQAAQKSGALITGYSALEQGKNVYAVPGRYDHELSEGCHKLILNGATAATKVEDFIVDNNINFSQQKIVYDELDTVDKIVNLCSIPRTTEYLSRAISRNIDILEEELFDLMLAGRLLQDHAGLWHKQ